MSVPTKQLLGLIWAESTNGVIGDDGKIPWHLPADLTHFKEITAGATVIMGRRTWESLPEKFRPLPGRLNIVVTTNPDFNAVGARIAHSVDDAIALAVGDIWVIGGQSLHQETIARADRLEVTQVLGMFSGDTFSPDIPNFFDVTADSDWLYGEADELVHRFVSYANGSPS